MADYKNPRGERGTVDPDLTKREIYDEGRLAEITWRDVNKPAQSMPEGEKVNRDAKGDAEVSMNRRGRPKIGHPREGSPDRNKARGRY